MKLRVVHHEVVRSELEARKAIVIAEAIIEGCANVMKATEEEGMWAAVSVATAWDAKIQSLRYTPLSEFVR